MEQAKSQGPARHPDAVHPGSPSSYLSRTTPAVPPVYQSTTFLLDDVSYADIVENEGLRETWYSRLNNPTVAVAALGIAQLEGSAAAVMTSSGMAAIATTLLTLCRAGDRIVAKELYGDTHDLLARDMRRFGMQVEFVPAAELHEWEAALVREPARVVLAETLSNPQLRLLDVPAVAAISRAAGATLIVDNTFATPFTLRPLEHGADVVINSVTKFLNGQSDVIAGCVGSTPELVRDVQRRIVTLGTCLDPHAAFLVIRGLRTYHLRIERQSRTAAELAKRLPDMAGLGAVRHLSLPSHPDFQAAQRLLSPQGRSAMITLTLDGGNDRAARFMRNLRVIKEATSLGGVETLISAPFNSSHFRLSVDEARSVDIKPGMVRLSVGVEDSEELLEDIEQALKASA
jgi:cystathionine beta-lyase/cystathionine gamma-synthase